MFRTSDELEEARVDRREAIVKRGERRRGFVPYWLRTMAEVDVDFLEAYERIYELTAVRKGKLPPKFREMIVVAAVTTEQPSAIRIVLSMRIFPPRR